VGALLAAAAVVMLVLVPSVRGPGSVRAAGPTPESTPASELSNELSSELSGETLRAFDAWAVGDPLSDVLGAGDEADSAADAFESEDFLSDEETWDSYLGESL